MRVILPLLLSVAPAAPLLAAQSPVPQLRDPVTVTAARSARGVADEVIRIGEQDSRVQDHLFYLTTRIGHRLTGSTNLTRACEWAAWQFESFGLEAHIEQWGEFPVGFDRVGERGGMIAPEEIEYVFRTPAWTAGTPGPVRAHAVLEPRTEEELAAMREELPGCWLVRRSRGRASRSVRSAIEAGIDAAGIAGEVRNGNERIVAFGSHRVTWVDLPTRVNIRLLGEQYDDLAARLEEGERVELEFDIDNRFLPGPFPLYNVIADIRGTELPDEYVIVGGHIDSWHMAQGTNDNGTGVATTLEAARLLMAAGAKPKRTIRFMLWSGEEQGLLGSRGWVESHLDLMPQISAVLVHDMGTNYLSGISCPPALAADLRTVFEPVASLSPDMPFEVQENRGFSRAGGSSDHASFLAEGVPGLFWEQAGRTTYGTYWHTHLDTFDSAVPEYQRHSAIVVAIGALGIANLDHLLDRTGLFAERPQSRRGNRRFMGVRLEGTTVTRVFEGSKADGAGWQEGDIVLSVDGVEVTTTEEVVAVLQKGEPAKKIVLQRGEEMLETTLDYSDQGDPEDGG